MDVDRKAAGGVDNNNNQVPVYRVATPLVWEVLASLDIGDSFAPGDIVKEIIRRKPELLRKAYIVETAVTRAVRRLVKEGYLAKLPSSGRRGVRYIYLVKKRIPPADVVMGKSGRHRT